MDPFSHAIVGGTAAIIGRKSTKTVRLAALCGVLAALSPDLDVLIRASDNPLLGLKFHRHFTHALAFVPLGSAIIAGFLWFILRRKSPFILLYAFACIGMITHGLLDSLTNYGTHLFWPFTEQRESWNLISIIDPIFTFTLLGFLIASLITKTRKFALCGAAFALLYFGFGYYQRETATKAMVTLAKNHDHFMTHAEVKPSLANMFVWRAQYVANDQIYTNAIHVSPWRGIKIYEGQPIDLLTTLPSAPPLQVDDLKQFQFFADGWLAYAPNDPDLIADMRFSALPNSILPMWGIKLQPEHPDRHVLFLSPRTRTPSDITTLWQMIKGEELHKM